MTNSSRIEFIIEADEPALFFSSKLAAERALEAADIDDGLYRTAYDRSGAVYSVTAYGGNAELVRDSDGSADIPGLMRALQRFLDAVQVPEAEADTLDQLLEKCEPYLSE